MVVGGHDRGLAPGCREVLQKLVQLLAVPAVEIAGRLVGQEGSQQSYAFRTHTKRVVEISRQFNIGLQTDIDIVAG